MTAYTGERLLLTLWVGCLWAIGYLAVPLAFMTMDTTLAGNYAGKLFQIVNYIGLACGVILLLSRIFMFGLQDFYRYWRSAILMIMLLFCLIFTFYIQPEMHQIKLLDWRQDDILVEEFNSLHKLSENLYMGLSLLGLLLVLTMDKKAEGTLD